MSKSLTLVILVLLVLLLAVVLLSILLGTADISVSSVFRILSGVEDKGIPDSLRTIVWKLRIPRTLLALFCGAALAAAGVVLQCLFRNPMADPFVMGISSGAAFGVALGTLIGLVHPLLIQLSSFAGALLSLALVLVISGLAGKQGSPFVILIAGIAVSMFFSSFMSLIMYLHSDQAEKILFWTFGSFSGASWNRVLIMAAVSIPGILWLLSQWRTLNILSQGDDTARSLGTEPERKRIVLLVLTSMITAVTVSMTGIIGFVGLMIPHIFRMIVGSNHRVLLPVSALGGAVFLILCDSISRVIVNPAELPVGILTAMLGAPYLFSILFIRRRIA